ncbi:MAG: hypothetical protein V7L00_24295 [Nostoc sp.]|uniref:hypothetical protein n=1 Tax=Nostoc sp. TaxID=1180 RepID=UPI002FF5775B
MHFCFEPMNAAETEKLTRWHYQPVNNIQACQIVTGWCTIPVVSSLSSSTGFFLLRPNPFNMALLSKRYFKMPKNPTAIALINLVTGLTPSSCGG